MTFAPRADILTLEEIDLVNFSRDKKVDISFIEEMPLGLFDEHNRALSFSPAMKLESSYLHITR
ncbi:hypothetical protein [uncultured Oceanicoccus sp.]|uniref:hypothetical protein n=1 Tax=uncultured Oceanicoccus sp. TaxID=1706381 RepID=UPI0030D7E93D